MYRILGTSEYSDMTDSTRLAGKVAFVTGGGSGLGKGACQRIAAEGGSVAVVDIRLPLAEAVADEINEPAARRSRWRATWPTRSRWPTRS